MRFVNIMMILPHEVITRYMLSSLKYCLSLHSNRNSKMQFLMMLVWEFLNPIFLVAGQEAKMAV